METLNTALALAQFNSLHSLSYVASNLIYSMSSVLIILTYSKESSQYSIITAWVHSSTQTLILQHEGNV